MNLKRACKYILVLIVFSLFPLASALTVNMKQQYQPGETLIAEISGTFLDALTPSQVYFYSENTFIPMIYDVGKIKDKYYIYSILPLRERNYTLIIKNAHYLDKGQEKYQDITRVFSVKGEVIPFSVNPGFIVTNQDFFITVASNSETQTVKSDFLGSSQTQDIQEGISKRVYFSTSQITNFTYSSIKFSSGNIVYDVPVAILISPVPPPVVPLVIPPITPLPTQNCTIHECQQSQTQSSCYDSSRNQTRSCTKNISGCWVWGPYTSLATCIQNYTCQESGSCIYNPSNLPLPTQNCTIHECQQSQTQSSCYDSSRNQTQTCIQNSSGCWVWGKPGNPQKCSLGYACESNGKCIYQQPSFLCPSTPECLAGQTEFGCYNQTLNVTRICEKNFFGCWVWSQYGNPQTCASSYICAGNGSCVKEQPVIVPPSVKLRFVESDLELKVFQNFKHKIELTLINTGQVDLEKIKINFSEFKSIMNVSPKEFNLDSGSSRKIYLFINSNRTGSINGSISANVGEYSTNLFLNIQILKYNSSIYQGSLIKIGGNTSLNLGDEKNCSELEGKVCSSNEVCNADIIYTIKGEVCCQGTCKAKEKESSSSNLLLAIGLIIGIIVVVFFIARLRAKKKPNVMKETLEKYEERYKPKEIRGNLEKV